MQHFDLKDKHNNIVIPDLYDGKVSLIMGELKDGVPVKRCGKLKLGKDRYASKDMPWKVSLGTPDQAIEALIHFLAQLGVHVKQIDDSDIPY